MDMASSNSAMDPKTWDKLPQDIVENVYLRLPLWSFFQLRGVCKAWNTLAQQRGCFTERIHKPYFVIVYPVTYPQHYVIYHAGILTLQIASGQWRWNRFKFVHNLSELYPFDFAPFSVNGLVFHSSMIQKIHDIHTKQKYANLYRNMNAGTRVVAMVVNTSSMPYDFKIIIGGLDVHTAIYTESIQSPYPKFCPSRIPAIPGQTWPTTRMKSCVQWDDCVYTWWQTTTILVYSLKEDKWTTLNPPENDGVGGALGCWDDRLFVVMEDGELSVSVWELVDASRQAWRPFARIPDELYSWLLDSAKESILASFCDRYVLLQTVLTRIDDGEGMRDHFVLFDLATKQWEKASLKENTQSNSDDTRRLGEHVGTSGRRSLDQV